MAGLPLAFVLVAGQLAADLLAARPAFAAELSSGADRAGDAPRDRAPAASAVPPAEAAHRASIARTLIPPAGEGLELIGECEVYAGETLYDYIDGGAPQYFEYGFHEVASQELRLRGRTYVLDVYRMADPVAAFGIYSTRRPERCASMQGFARSCYTGYQGLVSEGPVLLEIQAYETSDSTSAQMSDLAARVLRHGGPNGSPEERAPAEEAANRSVKEWADVASNRSDDASDRSDAASNRSDAAIDSLLSCLPQLDRRPGSERMARGPISLGAALGLSVGGDFLRLVEAVEKALPSSGEASPGARPRGLPIWLAGEYHATPAGEPRTTLLLLRGGPPAGELLESIRTSGVLPGNAMPLTQPPGWLIPAADGASWLAAASGRELLLASSRVPADTLQAWASRVTTR